MPSSKGRRCGYGSRARDTSGPDSDIDLLITAPDDWLAQHHRFQVLNDLWGRLAQADVSLDLLLYSRSECSAAHRRRRFGERSVFLRPERLS